MNQGNETSDTLIPIMCESRKWNE